jgi:hypothetical protein
MLRLTTFYTILCFQSFNAFGVMIGLCPATPPFGVIPCDSGCTGASAAKMAAEVSSAEFDMALEFNNLNSAWVEASNSDSDLMLSYMQTKQLSSNQRVTAYSASEYKLTSATTINARERSSLMDKLSTAMMTASENRKSDNLYKYIGTHHGAGQGNTRIPLMLPIIPLMSDPINSNSAHTDILVGWSKEIKDYDQKEANTLVLTSDDETLTTLVVGVGKLPISVSSEISKLLAFRHLYNTERDDVPSKKRSIKDLLAIDLLLRSYDIDPLVSKNITGISIAENWFASIVSQKSISSNKPRDLAIDMAVGQGIENVLLNEYLTLKKGKNLVRAFN